MSALSLSSPFPIFTDIDGNPLEDGYIYVGTAGLNPETNPISVYWDAALTVPAAQPIRTLGGYPSRSGSAARIYVDADDCSILVKNKNSSLIFSAVNQTTAIPSGIISFIQDGTDAVVRNVQDKMRESVSVEDFGAVGDNPLHDDWAAIQAAINTNLPVHFQGKTYYISKPLEAEWVSLHGVGIGSSLTPATGKTVIKKTTHALGTSSTRNGISYAADSVLSIVHPADSWSQGWNISGIDLQGISDGDRNAYAIYAPRVAIGSMTDVTLGFATKGFFGVSCWDLVWDHVQAYNCNTGFEHNPSGNPAGTSWSFNNVSTNGCGIGFSIQGLNYSTFDSCYAEGSTTLSWLFGTAKNIVLNGGGGENPTGTLLSINTSNIVINGWQTGPLIGIVATSAIEVVDSDLTLINCTLQDFSAVNGAKNVTITGSGSPSSVRLINSTIPTSGSSSTCDGFSTFVPDDILRRTALRGYEDVYSPLARDVVDTTTAVFFKNGVLATTGTPTYKYKQVGNVVFFTVYLTCTVSGAGAADIILDTPFNAADANSVFGTAYSGSPAGWGVATKVYSSATSRLRCDFAALAAGTVSIHMNGQMNLE